MPNILFEQLQGKIHDEFIMKRILRSPHHNHSHKYFYIIYSVNFNAGNKSSPSKLANYVPFGCGTFQKI